MMKRGALRRSSFLYSIPQEYFPIPVIIIVGCCDIEVGFDAVSGSTKLSRMEAEAFDDSLLAKYEFEAYGVENYHTKGVTMDQFIQRIRESNERDVGFFFIISDLDEKAFLRSWSSS